MTKLISGRVGKVPSANVRADRYQFLELSEAEPDLGLPSQLGQVFTSDLSGNRYWTRLDTANVTENGNLYFTNQRVTANVANLSIGILFDVKLGANLSTGKALVYDSNVNAFVPVFVNSEVANVADIAVRVLSLENQTTANVREASSNLYFTNTRVLDAISLATINPNNVNAKSIVTDSITSNIWNNLYTSNVVEKDNLFYTNSRVLSAVVPLLTTANVVESASNLYFTTTRARESVSNSTGVYYNTSSGVFSIGQDVALTSDVQFRDLTLSGNLFILGNVALIAANTLTINDPLIQVGIANPGDQWDLGLVGHYLDGGQRHAGVFRDATDGKFKFFSNTTVEPSNVNYIDTAADSFRLAPVVVSTLEGNVIGTVSSIANHNTDALAEGGTNRYYTNARVVETVTPLLTTGNVVELNNLYYTNARVLSNVEQMSINVLADVDLTGISVSGVLVWNGTKFVPGSTDAALRANFANTAGVANVAILADVANTVVSLNNHTTANLAEGTNLYFTNARARSAFTEGQGIAISSGGVISTRGNDTGLGQFNSGINLEGNALSKSTFSNVKIFNSTEGNSFLAFSFHITNISNDTAYLTGRTITDGNTVLFANLLEVPVGGSLEVFRKPQVFRIGDSIQIQGFDQNKVVGNNFISTYLSYQGTNDDNFRRSAITLTNNTLVPVYQSVGRISIVESINLVNLGPDIIPATVTLTTDSDVVIATLASNIQIPAFSSVEICEYPKTLPENFKIKAQKFGSSPAGLSVYTSSKFTSSYSVAPDISVTTESGQIVFDVTTTNLVDGTILWYETQSVSGNVNAADFVTANTGFLTVQNNGVRLTLVANSDLNTNVEGDETFKLVLRRASNVGSIVATTNNITLKDTSNTVVYNSLVESADTIAVNGTITFVLDTTNLGPNNIVYYSTVGNVTSADFVTGNTGSFITTGNTYTLVLTTA